MTNTTMTYGALVLRKLIDMQPINGAADNLPQPWGNLVEAVKAAPNPNERALAFNAAVTGLPEEAAIRDEVFHADPAASLDDLPTEPSDTPQVEPGERDLVLFTDMGNARRFAKQHAGRACFVSSWGWLIWSGKRWEIDETGQVYRLAKVTVKSLYRDAESTIDKYKDAVKATEAACELGDMQALNDARQARDKAKADADAILAWAMKSQGAARIEAMIKLAASEPEMIARTSDFDRNAWLLNCQNGILDLRTGALRAHDPAARLTKLAGAEYDPGAKCPTWEAFLQKIFSGKRDLINFMQRAAGYSLTGDVGEQCLFFLYGVGANGKSTFTGALQDVLGDYSMKTRAETLMVKRNESIPEEVAQLSGVRFMLAAELSEGQQLNESLIKDLTGGDKLRARLLYQKSFEYYPVAKPWLYGNHKPIIRGTDEGIWRRPKLIPFTVVIPPDERDKTLPAKLRVELAGILSWAVRGCLEWQRSGLNTPQDVTVATETFRAEQDTLAGFIYECLETNSLKDLQAGDMYKSYTGWARANGLDPKSQQTLSRQMTERGYTATEITGGGHRKYYQRLSLTAVGEQYKV